MLSASVRMRSISGSGRVTPITERERRSKCIASGFSCEAVEQGNQRGEGGDVLDGVPDCNRAAPGRHYHAQHLADRLVAIGKEHDAELTDDGIEGVIWKRQRLGRPFLPVDRR